MELGSSRGERNQSRKKEKDASFVCVSVWYLKGPFVASLSLSVCTNELRLLRIEATSEMMIIKLVEREKVENWTKQKNSP